MNRDLPTGENPYVVVLHSKGEVYLASIYAVHIYQRKFEKWVKVYRLLKLVQLIRENLKAQPAKLKDVCANQKNRDIGFNETFIPFKLVDKPAFAVFYELS